MSLHDLETSSLSDLRKSRVQGTLLPAGEIEPYRSTYKGDSGGPLMVHDNESNNWIQLGITSFSPGNKAEDPISFFTRVSSYKDWIDEIVENDFHHWLGEWKLEKLYDYDLDGYQPALEWILGLNPVDADPDWSYNLTQLELNESKTFVLPMTIRDSLPRLFLDLQTSTDLIEWNTIDFPYFDWASTPA
ncbi:MAG: trypsin-like serine protease, partial [Candidatus Poribacteria bacterium]|nr:trypsin-like serine protease [Candidatus Poribacteria bacterium]